MACAVGGHQSRAAGRGHCGRRVFTDNFNDRVRKLTPQPVVPATMNIVSGNNQQGNAGAVLSSPLVVKVTDRTEARSSWRDRKLQIIAERRRDDDLSRRPL